MPVDELDESRGLAGRHVPAHAALPATGSLDGTAGARSRAGVAPASLGAGRGTRWTATFSAPAASRSHPPPVCSRTARRSRCPVRPTIRRRWMCPTARAMCWCISRCRSARLARSKSRTAPPRVATPRGRSKPTTRTPPRRSRPNCRSAGCACATCWRLTNAPATCASAWRASRRSPPIGASCWTNAGCRHRWCAPPPRRWRD